MAIHILKRRQLLHTDLETAWAFFSNPKNLNDITPEDMHFEMRSDPPEKVYAGLMIEYVIKPFAGLSFRWVTEITQVEHGRYFVDEQRKGPYSLWHHEHWFEETEEGVWMTDLVHYRIGKWPIGALLGKLFVHDRVTQIFDHRFKVLSEKFAPKKATQD